MKRFLKILFCVSIFSYLIGEIIVRSLKLNSDHLDIQIEGVDGFVDRIKNHKGIFKFGKFPSNFSSDFYINDVGFNSPLNFKEIDLNLINIALVGDSYVESYHVGLENNIASILMNENQNLQVYPFGVSGYEFLEMKEIYQNFNLSKFDYVFFLLSKDDLTLKSNKPKFNSSKEQLRKVYNYFEFFKYINSNHMVLLSIKKLFSPKKLKINLNNDISEIVKFLNSKSNIIVIPKFQEEALYFKSLEINNILVVDHKRKPFNYGFDSHWNANGRINIGNAIFNYININ